MASMIDFIHLIFGIIPYFRDLIALLLELFYISVDIQWSQCRLIDKINHPCYLTACQM